MVVGKHATCLQLAKEAVDVLQDEKKSVSVAVRKLQICAELMGDKELQRWCHFHLGEYVVVFQTCDGTDMDKYSASLVKKLDEADIQFDGLEFLSRMNKSGGGFQSIQVIENILAGLVKEKHGNDGTHYRNNLSTTIACCANAAAKRAAKLYATLQFGDIPSRQFDVIRERVDSLLLDICPEAIEKFMSAYQMLGSSSAEDWSLALTACRRVIKAVGDALFPSTKQIRDGRSLGEEQYINRLWAFLDDHITHSSDKKLAKAHVDYLGSFLQRLNEKASKGVHANVTYEEAVRAVLYTYLTLGDVLEFAGSGVRRALSEKGVIDLNSASLQEIAQIPGISHSMAKAIVKARVAKPLHSLDDLLKIKGIGPKTIENLHGKVTVLLHSKPS